MEPIVAFASRWPAVVMLLATALAAAYLIVHAVQYPAEVAPWIALVTLSICAVFPIWKLVDSRPSLLIDDEGVFAPALGKIAWRDIESVRLNDTAESGINICVKLKSDSQSLTRSYRLQRLIFGSELVVNTMILNQDPQVVLELFRRKVANGAA